MDTARPRYRQVVRDLRRQILSGDPAPGGTLAGQSKLAGEHDVDSALINRALTALAAEGLVRVEHGRRTVVLPRRRWRLEFGAGPVQGGDAAAIAGAVGQALAAAGHPAVSDARAEAAGSDIRLTMAVESADLLGAVAAAAPVVRHAFGALPIALMSAAEA